MSEKNFDFENMLKMYEMFQSMNNASNKPPESDESSNDFNIDSLNESQTLKSMKAALPFVEPKYRKNIGMYIKLLELQRIMEIYSQSSEAEKMTENKFWKRDMLASIKPYVSEGKQPLLANMIKMLEMSSLINSIQEIK